MTKNIVQQAQQWFSENDRVLCDSFPQVNILVFRADDGVGGNITIQVDGPLVGATLSFWNKGDVMAIGIDKLNKKEFSFDNRVMTTDDKVDQLLTSYCQKLTVFAKRNGT